ncbi:MAG: hypothetical protein M3O70_12385 [Actinomycetota bacterium]|nr:hypothetical protein [Actinomycetota bacterium]
MALSRLALLAAAMAAAMILTGCGGGVRRASNTTPHVSPMTMAEATTTTEGVAPDATLPPRDNRSGAQPAAPPPAFKADTRPDLGQGAGPGPTSVAGVDVARHDEGFDRVVFHIAGDGTAGWHVRYVEAAHSQGSGDAVEVAGSAVLEVTLTNTGYPDDVAGPSYDGPRRIRPSDTRAIREIVNDHVYEGQHVFFVGTVRELPFRVFRLEGPQRVVVDIQHPR